MQVNQARRSQGKRQHPNASAGCRHIASPTTGLSTAGCPASAGPRRVTHTERLCVDSRQLQGTRRGPPSLLPARVDALPGGLLGSHSPQPQGLLGPSAGQALTGQAPPPQHQGMLGPSTGWIMHTKRRASRATTEGSRQASNNWHPRRPTQDHSAQHAHQQQLRQDWQQAHLSAPSA